MVLHVEALPRAMNTFAERFWTKVRKTSKHWFWTGALTDKGYGNVRVGQRFKPAHVVAWELQHGSVPPGLFVLHECDLRHCVRCLFLGTAKDNSEDMVRKGRSARGARNGMHTTPSARSYGSDNGKAVLNAKDVEAIRHARSRRVPLTELANKFNVSISTISRIANGKRWTTFKST